MIRKNWRLPLYIAVLSTLNTSAYAELTILPGETYINTVPLDNIDLISNNGTFQNDSTVNNLDFSMFNNQGTTINNVIMDFQNQSVLLNYGSFSNFGKMSFFNGASLNNYSRFVNSGSIEAALLNNQVGGVFDNDYLATITMNTAASVNNAGVFNNNGQFIINNAFSLNNSGTFYNNANLSATFQTSEIINSGTFENINMVAVQGRFVNTASGTFNNVTGFSAAVDVLGQLDNQGVFNNDGNVRISEGFDLATGTTIPAELNNSGTFNGNAGFIDAISQSGLNLNNAGVFNSGAAINSAGRIALNNSGVFNNTTTINLAGTGDGFSPASSGGSLLNSGAFNNNAGMVLGADYFYNSGVFENGNGGVIVQGQFINSATGVFNNDVSGIIDVFGSIDNKGQLDNLASIRIQENINNIDPVTGIVLGPLLDNSGIFNHSGNIDILNSGGFRLVNSGTFNNDGIINTNFIQTIISNSGVFNNNVNLDITSGGSFGQDQSSVVNVGTFNNNADLRGVNTLDNSGAVNNSSFIEIVASSISDGVLTNKGTFDNGGIVDVVGAFVNTVTGVFNNDINLSANGSGGVVRIEGVLDNQGEFNNLGGTIEISQGFDGNTGLATGGEIKNSGTFNSAGSINFGSGYGSGIINNFGEFNQTGQNILSASLVINNSGVFNNGQLFNTGFIPAELLLSINTQINNSGVLNNYRGLNGGFGSGTSILNTGIIHNSSLINGIDRFINKGTINNIDVTGNNRLVEINVIGALDNQGVINNAALSKITFSGYNPNGLPQNMLNSGTIINDGEINGTGIGDISNQGVITNNGSVTAVNSITSSGLITNNGSIVAQDMQISGELRGNGNIRVGNGLVITEAGTIAPGDLFDPLTGISTGTLNIDTGAGLLALDGTLQIEFGGNYASGVQYDVLNITGDVVLGANSTLDVSLTDSAWLLGARYDLMFANAINGDFSNFIFSALPDSGLTLDWVVVNGGGFIGDILRVEVVSAVPLPASVWLFLSGLAGLISIKRKKRV